MATTATPWCGTAANKLYLQSGQFSSTIKDSLAVGGIDSDPAGISYDVNGHTPWSGDSANRLYLQSGQFSSTLKTSLGVGGVDSKPVGISYDINGHTPWAGDTSNSLYLNSGQFESTMKTSLNVVGIDSQPHGISYDANGHTPWIGKTNRKLYLNSGQFESTVKTSLVIGGIETDPRGISFDGTNTPWCGWSAGSKLRLQSGQFESTMKTSISVAGVDVQIGDICTDDVNSRIGSGGPITLTITPTVLTLVAPTVTLVFEGLDLAITPTALTLVAPTVTYDHSFGTETSGEPDRIPRQPARTRRAMSQAGFKFNEPSGLILTAAGLKIRHSIIGGLGVNTAGNYVVAQDPIFVDGGGVGLTLATTPGLVISSGLAVLLKSGGHLDVDAGGLFLDESSLAAVFVPYTGATANVDLGVYNLTTEYVNITDQANGYQIDGVTMFALSATENILIGENAGDSITTGDYNICFGKDAGTSITDGYENICIGHETGKLITSGYKNTLLGYLAGITLTTGHDNVCIGKSAGERLTEGFENMVLGTAAGAFITTGDRNTLIGFSAGQGIVAENNNTFIGFQAGFAIQFGEDNTAVGRNSGRINTSGDGNTWIGMRTGSTIAGGNYSIVLGYHADNTAGNQFVVGSVEAPITAIYIGEGVTSATPQDLTFNATGGSGSNVAAGDLIFAGGKSTGNADPGDILLQTSTAGASGSTLQTLSTRVTISDSGVTLANDLDIVLGGTGFVQAGSEGFKVGTLTITDGTIDDTDGEITFGDTNLVTTGTITAGASTFGDGGSTNYVEISATGNLVFHGSGGMVYGEIYAHAVTDVIDSIAQNDWDQIIAFDTDGAVNNTTPAHGTDDITVTKAGMYLALFNWSGHGPAQAHDWDFHVSKNNNASQFDNVSAHITTPTTQKTTSICASGIIDLAVNDTIELWVKRTSAGANIDLTTEYCTLTLTQIGGT